MKPFAFQNEGADWLVSRRLALLADEMGLGKSVQAILAADSVGAERVLVICPAVARKNWLKEFERWSKYPRVYELPTKMIERPLLGASVICSFDYATRLSPELKGPWDLVIIDEVHFLKSTEAKRSKAIFGRDGVVRGAKRVWVLSGTPAPNHAGELWILLYSFGVTPLGYDAFVGRYCDTLHNGYGLQVLGTKRVMIPELQTLLARVMLRRSKSQVLKDMPPIFYSDFTVEPGVVELEDEPSFAQYISPTGANDLRLKLSEESAVLKSALELSKEKMAMLEGLAGSISTLRRYTGLQKVEPVAELVKGELEAGLYQKIVLFAVHKSVIRQLAQKLEAFGAVVVNGETRDAQAAVDAFQTGPPRVFLGNIQAAGTNITLTAAHDVLFVEQDFVPGNNAQAAMRCHRIGQTKPVSVRFVSLANPMEERLTQIINRKTRELSEIFYSSG